MKWENISSDFPPNNEFELFSPFFTNNYLFELHVARAVIRFMMHNTHAVWTKKEF